MNNLEAVKRLADVYAALEQFAVKLDCLVGGIPGTAASDIYEIPSVIFALIGVAEDDPAYYALEDYVNSDRSAEDFARFIEEAEDDAD